MKKLSAVLVLLTKLGPAKAVLAIALAVTALIVGGILVYELWQLCKTVLPTSGSQPQPTNSVAGNYYFRYYGDRAKNGLLENLQGAEWGNFNPLTYSNSFANGVSPSAVTQPMVNGFSFIYGLDSINTPFITLDSNSLPSFISQVLTNTPDVYSVSLMTPASHLTTVYTSYSTNGSGIWQSAVFGNQTNTVAVSNSTIVLPSGDTVQTMIDEPMPVVILRSQDLKQWVPICTNVMAAGTAMPFTDANWPVGCGFYKVMQVGR